MSRRLVVVTNEGCEQPFKDMFDSILTWIPDSITEDDTLLLEGGTDINPSYYDQPWGSFCQQPDHTRDAIENHKLRQFIAAGASILGICRGAQWACIKAGGSLIQHVTNHGVWKGHPIQTPDRDVMMASSVHHQMMNPFNLPKEQYELLAFCPSKRSHAYLDGKDNHVGLPTDFKEPEIVWFPKIRALAIQGHPEYMRQKEKFVIHCRKLVERHILEK